MLDGVKRRRLALPERGVEIALLDWGGDGPLALLHHANGFCAAMWGLVADSLRSRFHVVAMDARGHGDSSKPPAPEPYSDWENFGGDLLAVAERLASEHGGRVALGLGHSFGGSSFLMAASQRPDLFERLVLVDPITHPPLSPESEAFRKENSGKLAEGARKRVHVFESRAAARERWEGKDFFADWDPRALELYLAEGLEDRADGRVELKCRGDVEAAIFDAGRSFDAWSAAGRVKTPVLILWAARGTFPRMVYEGLVDVLPDARIVDADCGHLVPMERPDLVVENVYEFCSVGGSDG